MKPEDKGLSGDLTKICRSITRLGEALVALGRKSSLHPNETEEIKLPAFVLEHGDEALDEWMDAASRSAGLAAEPIETTHGDAYSFLGNSGPALIRLNFRRRPMFLAVIGRK